MFVDIRHSSVVRNAFLIKIIKVLKKFLINVYKLLIVLLYLLVVVDLHAGYMSSFKKSHNFGRFDTEKVAKLI